MSPEGLFGVNLGDPNAVLRKKCKKKAGQI